MNVLGISCFYHDSAACLVVDGEVVAAAQEERFSRKKHDNSFPEQASKYCLHHSGIQAKELDKVVFYEKPIQKFDRILETAAIQFPRGYRFFSEAVPEWLGTKLLTRKKIREKLGYEGEVEFIDHHLSHAASAFYPSPFEDAAILTVDGVGEWKTNQMFRADEDGIEPLFHIDFPDSLGLLYSAITSFLGFTVNNDEYKVMGLAAYGDPVYQDEFREFIEINEDGSYSLDQSFFSYTYSKKMWTDKLVRLLGKPRKSKEDKINERHRNIAATLQKILEETLLKQVETLYSRTCSENICMAGGVALNSVANGAIRRDMPFENIWIQPAAGDDGGAMGAALERSPDPNYSMDDVYLGPSYSESQVKNALESENISYQEMGRDQLLDETASRIVEGEILGLYQGRMEWGPRALGNRSILADPRKANIRDKINSKIKFRESFRPFAPTVLEEKASEYFDIEGTSPYMLFVFNAFENKENEIPSVIHVDGTSRIQTLNYETNPFYYDLIERFYEKTGVPVLLNTSLNLKGMPIVNRPEEALKVLQKSDMDAMVLQRFLAEINDASGS